MSQYHLLTPGPVALPPFVKEALCKPVIHHRTREFESFYGALLEDFRYLFQTRQHTLSMIGSGTYGVETAMYSLLRPGERVWVVNMGKFSQRWVDYARLLELEVVETTKNWGEVLSPEEVLPVMESGPFQAVVLTHCETSTGACIDLEEIAFAIKQQQPACLLLVDAISTLGAIPFYFDAWQIDCAVVAAQKALMNPAGTVVMALSEAARACLRPTHAADFRNLYNYALWADRLNYPYTPPVSLLYGLQAATRYLRQQRLPTVWNQTHQASALFKAGIVQLGGEVFGHSPSDSMTAFSLPDVSAEELLQALEQTHRIKLSGGQGPLKGKLARMAHWGPAATENARLTLRAIDQILGKNGKIPTNLPAEGGKS
ncbi:MAG: alanine--glyoxylate aminotransferase family protein [Bacteroidetes bacterium]|nr:MAG: alanine--glyoxylate aminotransferase family protein [Bacteroidota bacterium]